jgi:hypothetical protein
MFICLKYLKYLRGRCTHGRTRRHVGQKSVIVHLNTPTFPVLRPKIIPQSRYQVKTNTMPERLSREAAFPKPLCYYPTCSSGLSHKIGDFTISM